MKLKSPAAMFAAACIAAAGCASISTDGLEVAAAEGGGAAVRVDDYFFSRHVEVEDVNCARTDMGFLKASAYVRNKGARDFHIQYKFKWFDADGLEVGPDGRPWEQAWMRGGEAITLAAAAPDVSAVRFVVRIRRMQ
ncbi:MAG: DUF1425 domain-containing protein [Kiritimatiellae bacterium]|nr:DUF1425 domain-containing protein [Kiritimatiellia bacterium]